MAERNLAEIGVSGLRHTMGRLYEEPTLELTADRWRKALTEMIHNDPIIGAILLSIEMLFRGVSWRVDPANDSAAAADQAQFVDECRLDMSTSWNDTLAEILTCLPWGWAWLETVYKRRDGPDQRDGSRRSKYADGRIGWRKWALRAQETLDEWRFTADGGIEAMVQLDPNTAQRYTIPLTKSLLFRTSTRKGSPEGVSILRSAYTSYYYKTRLQRIEAIGIERDLAGLPVAYVPAEILSAADGTPEATLRAEILRIVTNIRNDEQAGVVFPRAYDNANRPLYDLALLASAGGKAFDTNAVIQRYDVRIAVSVLADWLLLGSQAVGSFALSSDKTALFAVAIGGWLDTICDVVNTHAIPRLLMYNGMDVALAPKLCHGDIEQRDIEQLGTYVEKLGRAGMPLFPWAKLEDALLDAADLPVPTAEERAALEAERAAHEQAERDQAMAELQARMDAQAQAPPAPHE